MLDCQSQTLVIGSLSNVEMVAKIWETLQLEESEAKKNKSNVKLIVEKGITGDLYQDCCSYIHSKDNLSLPLYQGFVYQANSLFVHKPCRQQLPFLKCTSSFILYHSPRFPFALPRAEFLLLNKSISLRNRDTDSPPCSPF